MTLNSKHKNFYKVWSKHFLISTPISSALHGADLITCICDFMGLKVQPLYQNDWPLSMLECGGSGVKSMRCPKPWLYSAVDTDSWRLDGWVVIISILRGLKEAGTDICADPRAPHLMTTFMSLGMSWRRKYNRGLREKNWSKIHRAPAHSALRGSLLVSCKFVLFLF